MDLGGTYTSNVTLSTSNKTEFIVQGSSTKTITYEYTTSSWWGGNQTYTLYLGYDSGWEVSNSNYIESNLHLLTYELLPSGEITEDVTTLVNINVFGGNVVNNIYGGANQNNIYGTVDIDIENGVINGVVYGGSNIKGTVSGSVLMDIIGGQLGTLYNDSAFGGGLGSETNVKGRVLLNIKETKNNLNIYGNIYGGSSLGTISGNVDINVQDLPNTANTLFLESSLFGGGKGDNNTAALVNGNVTINVDGCNLEKCSVFGGSDINGVISGTITVNIGKTYKSTIYSVYGGGNEASINTDTQGVFVYILSNANITNAFNGGKSADLLSTGEEDTTRAIFLQGGTVENLFGGSDSSGTVTASHVYIESGNVLNADGGNNLGGTTISSNVITTGGTIRYIFGGGNQAGVTTTNVQTNGGNIGFVFGGSNTSGDVNESFVTTNDSSDVNLNNGVTMTVTTTASKTQSWQSTTYPTFAKISVVFKNNTSKTIETWKANVFAPESVLLNNYSQSDIQVNNGVYTLTE